jgi:hypothetical protein
MGMHSYVVGFNNTDEKQDEEDCTRCLDIKAGKREYRADMKDGFEIDLSKLDPNIKLIRFVNSY